MTFQAQLGKASLKPAQPTKADIGPPTPPILKIELLVEDPGDELFALIARLARSEDAVKVELSSYQLAMAAIR